MSQKFWIFGVVPACTFPHTSYLGFTFQTSDLGQTSLMLSPSLSLVFCQESFDEFQEVAGNLFLAVLVQHPKLFQEQSCFLQIVLCTKLFPI